MSVRVRRLMAGDDLGAAARLLAAFFAEAGFAVSPATVVRHVEELAGLDVCGLFQAQSDKEAIGIATVSLGFGIEYGWSGEMDDLYVAPDWRGRGVAADLIAAVEAFLIRKGAAGYQVTVTADAEARHGLTGYYRKAGFRDEGRRVLFKELR